MDRGSYIEYRHSNGRSGTIAPAKDQVRLTNAKVSDDGQVVGWLAEYKTCCASYSLPLRLEVRMPNGQRRTFPSEQPVWGWCFVYRRMAVAYRHSPTHGDSEEVYELRRISDSRLLARSVHATSVKVGQGPLPEWAECASARYDPEA